MAIFSTKKLGILYLNMYIFSSTILLTYSVIDYHAYIYIYVYVYIYIHIKNATRILPTITINSHLWGSTSQLANPPETEAESEIYIYIDIYIYIHIYIYTYNYIPLSQSLSTQCLFPRSTTVYMFLRRTLTVTVSDKVSSMIVLCVGMWLITDMCIWDWFCHSDVLWLGKRNLWNLMCTKRLASNGLHYLYVKSVICCMSFHGHC